MQHTRLRRLSPEAYESSVAALLAFVCLDDLQGGGARHGAAGSNKPRMDSLAAGAVHQCYMRRTVQHVLVAPFHQGEQHQRRDTAVAGADGRPGANAGLGASADPDERVLYQSRADDFRRGVCRPALRLPGAVTHYGWLTAGQMMDGLALGNRPPDR